MDISDEKLYLARPTTRKHLQTGCFGVRYLPKIERCKKQLKVGLAVKECPNPTYEEVLYRKHRPRQNAARLYTILRCV